MDEPASDLRPGRVTRMIRAVEMSTAALFRSIAGLDDEQSREPSLLPGWTRGHVLTHLARNADGLRNLLTWARTGVETPMYASHEQRAADIEAGAHRPASALVNDVHRSSERLAEAYAGLTEEQWARPMRMATGRAITGVDVPWLRRVEVEVHHVDLDLEYTLAHLPADVVGRLLDETAAALGDRDDPFGFVLVDLDGPRRWVVGAGGPELAGSAPSLLGWVLGRTDGVGVSSQGPLPHLGGWR
jgi:maleylpyruvate isomerase